MDNTDDQNTIQNPEVTPSLTSQTPPTTPPFSKPPGSTEPKAKAAKLPFLLIGIILFLLITGSAAGFYVFKNQGTKQIRCTEEAKVCPDGTSVGRTGTKCEFTPCPNAKIIPNPTTDWQIYAGEGFTFKYPSTLKPITIEDDKTVHLDYSEVIPKNEPDGYEQGPGFRLSFLIKNLQFNLKDAFNADFKNNSLLKEIVLKDIKQGEYSGFTFYAQSTYIYLSSNKGKYIVINYSVNDKNNKGYQLQIDQILSTFKFAESNLIPTPTCMSRPACLDSTPRCMIAEPASGWCP